MPVVLYRVDERLIHGQVVIGWGHELRPDRYVLVDDALAASGWEKELYRLATADVEIDFVDLATARDRLAEWRTGPGRTIVLTRDVATMRALAEGGRLTGERVNLGGLHHGPGRSELLDYLHVTDVDRNDLKAMALEGVELSAQDLPDAPRVPLATLLKGDP